jgi:hypothetical protein
MVPLFGWGAYGFEVAGTGYSLKLFKYFPLVINRLYFYSGFRYTVKNKTDPKLTRKVSGSSVITSVKGCFGKHFNRLPDPVTIFFE